MPCLFAATLKPVSMSMVKHDATMSREGCQNWPLSYNLEMARYERIANNLFFDPPLWFQNFGCQGQGGDENLRKMKHTNVFPYIQGMIKS